MCVKNESLFPPTPYPLYLVWLGCQAGYRNNQFLIYPAAPARFTPPNVSHVTCFVSCVTCHMSRVRYHVSHVTCHNIFFIYFFFYKVVKLIGGGSVINGAYPV